MPVVSLQELLESGVHFGHQTRRWHPRMAPYIYTARNGVHIIDLVQTAQLLDDAYTYLSDSSSKGQRVLFVGTKRQAAGIIAQEASRSGSYYINQRWLGGMLTNWETIKTRVERLKELERLEESGALARRPKKEAAVLRRELEKLQKYLGGIKTMRRLPDIVVIVDQKREYNAISECRKLGIPIVSLLDTNCDPEASDIPIPANDDAIRSIKLIVGKLADAIYEGRHGQFDTEAEDRYEDFDEALDEYEEDEEGFDYPDAQSHEDDEEESSNAYSLEIGKRSRIKLDSVSLPAKNEYKRQNTPPDRDSKITRLCQVLAEEDNPEKQIEAIADLASIANEDLDLSSKVPGEKCLPPLKETISSLQQVMDEFEELHPTPEKAKRAIEQAIKEDTDLERRLHLFLKKENRAMLEALDLGESVSLLLKAMPHEASSRD